MTKNCPFCKKPRKGTVAAFAAGTAAAAGAVATLRMANGVVSRDFTNQAHTNDRAFFERLARTMPGTEGLEFAESRSVVKQKVAECQGDLYADADVERVTIPAANPDETAVAYCYRGSQPTDRWAILLHGYRADHYEMDGYALYYLRRGFNVLSPDLHGQGESDGAFIGMGLPEASDIWLWADYLRVRFGEDSQIVLHGHSLGAVTAIIAATEHLPLQVKAIVADSAYSSALAMIDKMACQANWPGPVLASAVRLVMLLRSGIDLARSDALAASRRNQLPTLFIHGGCDHWIPSTMAVELYTGTAAGLRELRVVPGAGHGEAFAKDPDAYFALVDRFLQQAGVAYD
ncbi:MAG: alpha/beta hydrolase [Eggerthellaceae bacterium]|jgi:pimeloyl-ACP methyl ester carboxylesterase